MQRTNRQEKGANFYRRMGNVQIKRLWPAQGSNLGHSVRRRPGGDAQTN